ncbi:MAG: alpha-amylase family glycosyl hydrolase [Candidatus Omnitrophota bacterium]
MINSTHHKIQKIISCVLIQIFVFTSLLSSQDTIYLKHKLNIRHKLRVPIGIDKQRSSLFSLTSNLFFAYGEKHIPVTNKKLLGFLDSSDAELSGFDEHGNRKIGEEVEKWREFLLEQETGSLPGTLDKQILQDPVKFAGWLVENLKKADGDKFNYRLYLALMSYAGFVRYHNGHGEGYQIALQAVRLKPGKEEQDQAVVRYVNIFMQELKETDGSVMHRLKQTAVSLESKLAEEFKEELPWNCDLIRHLIGYINQASENSSEFGGDITMVGLPVKLIEYLEEIYNRSGVQDEDVKALIEKVKTEYENNKSFESTENPPFKKPRIIKQVNLDAECKTETNRFKWLANNIARYKGYDSIMLMGSLQAMGAELSPYSYFGLYFDPRYGNDEDFRLLVDTARKNGVEIIVDIVLEHTGGDLSGRPFPDRCYSNQPSPWGYQLDYSKDETVLLATWFLRRLRKLGVQWVRCDQMGGLSKGGYRLWENAKKLGLGLIGEWEHFLEVPHADLVLSKSQGQGGIHNELRDYGSRQEGQTSFKTLQGLLKARLRNLSRPQSSWVIFDDHDEAQYGPIINAIGKDMRGEWNIDKLRAYYLGVYMAWISLSEEDRQRVSIMEYSGTAEGYTHPLFYMYGFQGYVDLEKEAERIFPGFAEFSEKVREIVKEILDYEGKVEVRYQHIGDDYEGIVEVDFKDEAGNSVKMYTLCVNLRGGQYRSDIQVIEKDKLLKGMMDPASLLFLRSGQIVTEPKWLKLQTALDMVLIEEGPVTAEGIREKLESKMKALGILKQDAKLSAEYVVGLLGELSASGLIEREKGYYKISGDKKRRTAALWCNDYDYIRKEIESKLGDSSQLNALLLSYEKYAKELWPYYPVEAFYPIWDAVSTMDEAAQQKLIAGISGIEKTYGSEGASENFYSHTIFDSIRLTLLPPSKIPDDWLKKYAPNLIGKTIVIAAPEISRMAGGLGRVTVSKSVAIKRFIKDKARLVWAEPYYNDFNEDPGEKIIDDLEVEFRGRVIHVEVYRRIKEIAVPNERGETEIFEMEDYLIRDKERYYVGKLYKYGKEDSRVTQDEFTDFFSAAVTELVNRMAQMADESSGKEGWGNILLSLHDSQVLPAAFYRRYLYQKDSEKYAALARIPISGVTHTYNNRAIKYFKNLKEAREFLRDKRGIKDEYHWYYLSKLPDGQIVVDDSSVGLRTSHMPNGVSRIHAFEVSEIDALPLRGLANGDLRELSAKEFRKILLELYPDADVEHPTIEQMIAADKKAKEKLISMLKEKKSSPLIISGYLELDPEKIIISYSGRLVPEKLGIGEGRIEEGGTEDLKAFTKENIRKIVKKGAQVIFFANAQPYRESIALYRELRRLAEEIEDDKKKNGENSAYKGTFILVDKFTPEEQRVLLAATNVQGQVSRRGTGAEEFKEADVTASGGKQLAAPWIEGGTQISLGSVGVNLIVPCDNTEGAFWEAFNRDIDFYNNNREAYARNEVNSIPLSRKLTVSNTIAAYLIWWSEVIGENETFDIKLMGKNDAMTEANINLSAHGIQISRAEPALGETLPVDLSDGKEEVFIEILIAPGVEPPRAYVRTNAMSSPDTPDDAAWVTIPLELEYFQNGKAIYKTILKGIRRQDCALTFRVGNVWLGEPGTNAILHSSHSARENL